MIGNNDRQRPVPSRQVDDSYYDLVPRHSASAEYLLEHNRGVLGVLQSQESGAWTMDRDVDESATKARCLSWTLPDRVH